jgi:hypothetical protein
MSDPTGGEEGGTGGGGGETILGGGNPGYIDLGKVGDVIYLSLTYPGEGLKPIWGVMEAVWLSATETKETWTRDPSAKAFILPYEKKNLIVTQVDKDTYDSLKAKLVNPIISACKVVKL